MKISVFTLSSVFAFIFSSFILRKVEASGDKLPCPDGMENIYGTPLGACYALVDPAKGPMTYKQAKSGICLFSQLKTPSKKHGNKDW